MQNIAHGHTNRCLGPEFRQSSGAFFRIEIVITEGPRILTFGGIIQSRNLNSPEATRGLLEVIIADRRKDSLTTAVWAHFSDYFRLKPSTQCMRVVSVEIYVPSTAISPKI